mmetsp:Transcript_19670/g.33737  ORF Transcript_19670/g.33737 Transcript_19670/m.33737 type:complete len:180 (+) Transcript_19670:99-638(+)|eukprot:CAMPEP_0196651504 /NCGR_PEP_ID=MMETSP1086-20130531/491_1 /TAXON_ID=77921 /ORGANISM="Cyanoptyche  gloeocystis , Strain SAG4.97" /LENGTH=179 /DNA_ID=CAMNT_0041981537 /DNA_START=109 /DNA_END=648 /DNA_ORIENTATION=+
MAFFRAVCGCGPKKTAEEESVLSVAVEDLPTCPPCLMYETYYRPSTASGKCKGCQREVPDHPCTLCATCSIRNNSCYFCGAKSDKDARQWIETIEKVVGREVRNLTPSVTNPREMNSEEDTFRDQLREEWQIFLGVWKDILTRNPKPEKIMNMRQEYLAAAETFRVDNHDSLNQNDSYY